MNRQIYEEAANWLVDFRSGDVDAAASRRFDRWLRTSPEHVRAYIELTRIWGVINASGPTDRNSIDALIERGRTASNIVALDLPGRPESRNDRPKDVQRSRHRPSVRGLLAVATCILSAVALTIAWLHPAGKTYSTAVGEHRSIPLPDGSTVALNARSAVRVHFSKTRRDIELLAGQALFNVAKDKTRPFIVTSDRTQVRAVGTQFDVNQLRRTTIITVVEGTVAVLSGLSRGAGDPTLSRDGAGPQSMRGDESKNSSGALEREQAEVLLAAGEQAILTRGARLTPKHADVVVATAWTQRRLIFEATPLDEVAEEFNRYNTRKLIVEGAGLDDFHVSGAFSSSDPAPLLRFLRAQDSINVAEHVDQIIVSTRR